MTIKRHGMSIGIERTGSQFYVTLAAQGKLTHEDYQTITPMLDEALGAVDHPKVNVLVDATALEGWEMRAAWDDFRLGLKHNKEFQKVAIYGNRKWQEVAAKTGSWFISGEAEFFTSLEEAVAWLHE